MVLEHAIDATFSIRYSRESDRFTIDGSREISPKDIARLNLDDDGDFILFDNDRPGTLHLASHKAANRFAIDTLAHAVFDHNYALLCECLREGAKIYNSNERSAKIIVPYSNRKRLGRIILHVRATNTSKMVIDMHQRIIDAAKAFSSGDGGGEDPLLST